MGIGNMGSNGKGKNINELIKLAILDKNIRDIIINDPFGIALDYSIDLSDFDTHLPKGRRFLLCSKTQ